MEVVKFIVLGSTGDSYEVRFEKGGEGRVHAFCTCEAGQNGIYCKHRFGIIDGQYDRIASGNVNDLVVVKEMMKGSDLQEKYEAVLQAEDAHALTKRLLAASKKELARAMYR
jgi:hypothetical protein